MTKEIPPALEARLKAGNEPATAALMYALVKSHYVRQEERISVLRTVYHRDYAKYVFSKMTLLQAVVGRFDERKAWDPDAIVVWKRLPPLYLHLAKIGKQPWNGDLISSISQSLDAFIRALARPKLPCNAEDESTINAIANAHCLIRWLLEEKPSSKHSSSRDLSIFLEFSRKKTGSESFQAPNYITFTNAELLNTIIRLTSECADNQEKWVEKLKNEEECSHLEEDPVQGPLLMVVCKCIGMS